MNIPDEILVRQVAAETLSDFRTIRRELREPGSVRGVTGARIRLAIKARQANGGDTRPAA